MLHPLLAIRDVIKNGGIRQAESLSFKTMWSMVPTLVLLTAVMGKVGYLDILIKLVPEIWDWLGLKLPMDNVLEILRRAQKVNFASLGLMGAGALFFTFYGLMSAIDNGINEIWGISKNRRLHRRVLVYFPFLILLAVFLILLSKALVWGQKILDFLLQQSQLPNNIDTKLESLFFLGVVIGILTSFILGLMWFMPRAKLRFWPVFWASLATSIVLFSFLTGVSFFQGMLFTKYKAFWGSMALFPLFLLVQLGFWLIILWGSALCRQFQTNPKFFAFRKGKKR